MNRLAQELANTQFSRGAIYRAQLWFEGLTDDAADARSATWRAQMASSLAYQFKRQKGSADLARQVVDHVCDVMQPIHPRTAIDNFLVASEFFAREARVFSDRARAQPDTERAAA